VVVASALPADSGAREPVQQCDDVRDGGWHATADRAGEPHGAAPSLPVATTATNLAAFVGAVVHRRGAGGRADQQGAELRGPSPGHFGAAAHRGGGCVPGAGRGFRRLAGRRARRDGLVGRDRTPPVLRTATRAQHHQRLQRGRGRGFRAVLRRLRADRLRARVGPPAGPLALRLAPGRLAGGADRRAVRRCPQRCAGGASGSCWSGG